MRIYSYCSYDGSPCGFRVGCLEKEDAILKDISVPKIIQKSFDCGYVDFVCGTEPDKSETMPYIIVMKKLQTKRNQKNFYLNFALEMSREEYIRTLPGIMEQYNHTETFACMLADMVIPDTKNAEFGLTLHREGIETFLNCVQSSDSLSDTWLAEPHKLFLFRKILPDTQNRDRSKEIAEDFGFDKSVKVVHDAEKHCHIAQLYDINSELKARKSELFSKLNKIIKRKES